MLVVLLAVWFGSVPGLFGQEAGKAIEKLETERGRIYKKVEILHRDPHGITFRHSNGIAKIPFSEFTQRIREEFNYVEDDALEFLREHAAVLSTGGGRSTTDGLVESESPKKSTYFAYRISIRGAPVTLYGPIYVDALPARTFVTPSWLYPAPANVPYDMYLWRQMRLADHLRYAHAHAHRTLRGYGDVRRSFRASFDYVPAIGAGRSVPAIGAGFR